MEHSLTKKMVMRATQQPVLILILMEHSLTLYRTGVSCPIQCLNPYSNGTLSDLNAMPKFSEVIQVLILILMEHSLTTIENYEVSGNISLNPYSNGRYSRRTSNPQFNYRAGVS